MLNDILTGASSSAAETADPYRTRGEVPPTLVCASCGQAFPPAQAMNGMCRTCAKAQPDALAQMMDAQAKAAADRNGVYVEMERRRRNALIFRVCILIAIGVGMALFRYGMRKQLREDMDEARGVKSYER